MPQIILIAAMAQNRVIGKDGDMPWHLPPDLKRFKTVTSGNTVIMGRKTFEAVGRPLPNRRNIVISRASGQSAAVEWAHSLDDALSMAAAEDQVFVIGGGQIYAAALPQADALDLCEIDLSVEGDAHFPAFSIDEFEEVSRESYPAEANQPGYSFVHYRRRRSTHP